MMPAKKGTILYVGGFEMPDKNAAAHRVISNAKVLNELGYRVIFVGITHEDEVIRQSNYDCFKYFSTPYPKSLSSWFKYLTGFSTISEIANGIDDLVGIIFYNYQAIALKKGLSYCCSHGLFSIVDVTEWYLPYGHNPIVRLLKKLDTSLRMRRYNKRADGIIAISKFLFDYYNSSNCNNIIQVPPLIDKTEKKWKPVTALQYNKRIHLVFAGNSYDLKDNLKNIITVVSKYKESIDLKILGVEKDTLSKTIPHFGSTQNVVALGKKSHQECLNYIKSSHFQIFIREDNLVTKAGFPTKLGESFACGTPVITNLSSNIGDYLIEGKNGFIVNGTSPEDIDKVIKMIIRYDSNILLRMKQYCKGYDCFQLENYIEPFSELLRNVSKK